MPHDFNKSYDRLLITNAGLTLTEIRGVMKDAAKKHGTETAQVYRRDWPAKPYLRVEPVLSPTATVRGSSFKIALWDGECVIEFPVEAEKLPDALYDVSHLYYYLPALYAHLHHDKIKDH